VSDQGMAQIAGGATWSTSATMSSSAQTARTDHARGRQGRRPAA
jgi:hypothetical protein